jgi:hypothetical protein
MVSAASSPSVKEYYFLATYFARVLNHCLYGRIYNKLRSPALAFRILSGY